MVHEAQLGQNLDFRNWFEGKHLSLCTEAGHSWTHHDLNPAWKLWTVFNMRCEQLLLRTHKLQTPAVDPTVSQRHSPAPSLTFWN